VRLELANIRFGPFAAFDLLRHHKFPSDEAAVLALSEFICQVISPLVISLLAAAACGSFHF
jgi:hypothetical protein